ncbi:YdeI/OmpD-associated family protein [Winogradskyella sp. HB-48]|uniref:YdeI/OmpD-associated family protein n=1 Tax=Winogradskyella sp. HB-48 TaxID=3416808 RepID=UPI003CF46446
MKKVSSVEEYIEVNAHFAEELSILREIINSTELEESIKWNAPTYTLNGKNVIGLGAFKNHFGIWFFQGVFLKDEANLLVNAQENKTKALRQMRFESIADINKSAVLNYVKEAIENQRLGKEIMPQRNTKPIAIPKELESEISKDKELKQAFEKLSASCKREYCEHISEAKREATKIRRLEKIIPMILEQKGLHDKYKNC